MSVILALPEAVVDELRAALAFDYESAWTGVARIALDGRLLLTSELRAVPDDAYEERSPQRMRIASRGFMPAFTAAARDPASIPIFVHTHPRKAPRPSDLDDAVDGVLCALAESRTGRPGYASIIVGGSPAMPRVTGRLWRSAENFERLDRLRAAGPHLRPLLADDREADGPPRAMFDRQVRAFGPEGQRLLRSLTIAVVGGGGTGSPTVEQLARLGVGRVVVVDDDVVDRRNLTRIHESAEADVGRLKVEVARERAEACGTGTVVEAIPEKAISEAVIRRLAGCDLVFGCTDDNAGRLVLSKLAYHYLVPVIDLGVQVDIGEGSVRGVHGRVTVAAPGYSCLECRGQVDLRLAAAEQMNPEERARQAEEGYVPGVGEAAPAVVSYTTLTSATAVTELTARLFGFGEEPPPGQLLLGLHNRSVRAAGRPARPGHYCSDPARWAKGDTIPPLGIAGIR
jgi:molybdopterin/thiamine biosynthesis adenylyltransferase/proteasome lid subunit RPN8/RPN11